MRAVLTSARGIAAFCHAANSRMMRRGRAVKCWNFSIAIRPLIPYMAGRFMNRFILSILSLAVAVGLSACDKKNKPRQKPAQGPNVTEPGAPTGRDHES